MTVVPRDFRALYDDRVMALQMLRASDSCDVPMTSAGPRRAPCPLCGGSLVGRRVDAEVCGPKCQRERSRLRALLAGEGSGPYATVAEYQARRRNTRAPDLHTYAAPL